MEETGGRLHENSSKKTSPARVVIPRNKIHNKKMFFSNRAHISPARKIDKPKLAQVRSRVFLFFVLNGIPSGRVGGDGGASKRERKREESATQLHKNKTVPRFPPEE